MSRSKIDKIKIKKLVTQYEFLLNEYEETIELFQEYEKDFYNDNKHLKKENASAPTPGESGESGESGEPGESGKSGESGNPQETEKEIVESNNQEGNPQPAESDNPEEPSINIDADISEGGDGGNSETINEKEALKKVIYKYLSLLTHPDKNKGSDLKFKEVTEAYKNGTLSDLLVVLKRYNYTVDLDKIYVPSLVSFIEADIGEIKKKIDFIKSSLAWIWGTSDENVRQSLKEKLNF